MAEPNATRMRAVELTQQLLKEHHWQTLMKNPLHTLKQKKSAKELLAVQRRKYAAGGDFLTVADFERILPEGDCGGEVRRRVRARSVCV